MDNSELDELYQTMVLEHSKKPRNFGTLENSLYAKGKNPSCGDEIDLYMHIEGNYIKDVKFKGQGCALCIASTSIFTDLVKGKDSNKATETINEFVDFITKEKETNIEKLQIFEGIKKFPLRVKCVLLGWRTAESLLKK
jgi:nitrogen fixation protein NifU and related proteins